MQPPTNLLLPALLFGAIGIIIGVVVVLLIVDRTRVKSEQQKEASAASATPTEPTSDLPTDKYTPIARLVRERVSGRLAVEVDNKLYLSSYSAPPQVRDLLDDTSDDLAVWLGKPLGRTPQPVASTQAAPVPPFVAPEPVRSVPAVEPQRSNSIVDQIDEILQEMLENSSLSDRKISITQEPSMGVVVWVDGIKYPGVDSVAEADVKNLIKDAVKKWEKKNDPGNRY